MLFGGDHIQVIEKHRLSQINPNSLGFVSCFGRFKNHPLLCTYDVIFYRIGKRGKPRLVKIHEIPLPTFPVSVMNKYRVLERCPKGLCTIKVLSRFNLLECKPIVFICYLASKWHELYSIVAKFRNANFVNGLISRRLDFSINDFLESIPRTGSLSSYIELEDKILRVNYHHYILQAMRNDEYKNMLLERYKDIELRISELKDLRALFGKYQGINRWYIQDISRRITDIRAAIHDRRVHIDNLRPSVVIDMFGDLQSVIYKRLSL